MSAHLKRRYPFPTPVASDPSSEMDIDTQSPIEGPKQGAFFGRQPLFPNPRSLLHSLNSQDAQNSVPSSANSSPTTTISTVDSAVTEDRTPSTSPNSPISIIPLSSFMSKNTGMLSAEDLSTAIMPLSPAFARPLSPSKKPRNTKNLSLNMGPPSSMTYKSTGPSTSLGLQQPPPPPKEPGSASISAPSSPAFLLPPPLPRRRPSNLGLTIKLPGTGSLPLRAGDHLKPTLTGSLPAPLRHMQSSPSLFSPGPTGPNAPMTLPPVPRIPTLYNPQRPPSSHASPTSSQTSHLEPIPSSPMPHQTTFDPLPEDPYAEEPLTPGAAKTKAYPKGPVCIFEPNIYLYAEPDAELASTFDLVINVAREVENPFEAKRRASNGSADGMDGICSAEASPTQTVASFESFESTFDRSSSAASSSSAVSTPTAVDSQSDSQPEYVHMLWDHNTSINSDLPNLVELMHEREKAGKKILVHCQCGVSRSASLIIAYSMYKNPRQTVQEAYKFVKSKSDYIGPNMSLIYQLQDWQGQLAKKDGIAARGNAGKGNGYNGRPTSDPTPFAEIPQTAPLPGNLPSPGAPPMEDGSEMVRTRSEGQYGAVTPGPASAPPSYYNAPPSPLDKAPSSNGETWGGVTLPQTAEPPIKISNMMEIPGKSSAATHNASFGFGDPGVGYAPPPLPPDAAFSIQRESDIVGRYHLTQPNISSLAPPPPSRPAPPPPKALDDTLSPLASPRLGGFFPSFATLPRRRPSPPSNGNNNDLGGLRSPIAGMFPMFTNPSFFSMDPRSPPNGPSHRRTETPVIRSIFDVL